MLKLIFIFCFTLPIIYAGHLLNKRRQFDTLLKLGLDVINNTDDDRSFDQEICAIICSSFNILLIKTV